MNKTIKKLSFLAAFALTIGLLWSVSGSVAHAQSPVYTCTWTAGSDGDNANFSDAANWSGCNGAAPQPSDDDNLIFNTNYDLYNGPDNDISGLTVNNITFTGASTDFAFNLLGNSMTVTGGITDSTVIGDTAIYNDLIMNGPQTISTASSIYFYSLQGSGDLTLNGGNIGISDLSSYTGAISSSTSNIQLLPLYNSFTSSGSISSTGNSAVTLNDEQLTAGTVTFSLPITLGGNGISKIGNLYATSQASGSNITFNGALTLNSDITITTDQQTTLGFTGAINYNSHTISSLTPNDVSISLSNGDNQSTQTAGIGSNIALDNNGTLGATTTSSTSSVTGSGTYGNATFNGSVSPGEGTGCININGTLNLTGTYNANLETDSNTPCTDFDQIVSTGDVNLTGSSLKVSFPNGFTAVPGQNIEIINNQSTDPITGTFNNLPEGTIFTVGKIAFQITYVGGDGNDVVLKVVSSSSNQSNIMQRQNGELDYLVQGPNNSLVFYYNFQGSPIWNSIVVAGNGTTYGSPSAIQRVDGETDVAVQGPNNTLDFYYNFQGSPVWNESTVAFYGSIFSQPSITQRPSGETDIAVEGPNHILDFYFNFQGSPTWNQVKAAGDGTTYSQPTLVQRADGETDLAVTGAGNSLDFYYNFQGSPVWNEVTAAGYGTTYSQPSLVQRADGETDLAIEGPSNSLDFYYNFQGSPAWNKVVVAGTGTTFSQPSMLQRPSGETDLAVQANSHNLDFYYNFQGSPVWNNVFVGSGSIYGQPSMIQRPSGETDIISQGPNNSMNFIYNPQGSPGWYGIDIAGNGSFY